MTDTSHLERATQVQILTHPLYIRIKTEILDVNIIRDANMSKKSITTVGKTVEYAYVIKDVNIDNVSLEKYAVKCSSDIESAWVKPSSENSEDQIVEVVLQEKISNITLSAKADVVDNASKNGGKIIQDFITDIPKRGKKVYISELKFFKEVGEVGNVEKIE